MRKMEPLLKMEWLAVVATLSVSLILLVLPDRLFAQTDFKLMVEILLRSVNKLHVDSEVVSKAGDAAVARYAVSFAFSLVSTICLGSVLIFQSCRSFQSPPQPPRWATKPNLLIMPMLLGAAIYLAVFDTFLPRLEASRSQGLFGTGLSVFWFPLVFAVVLVGTRRTLELFVLYRRNLIWDSFPP